MMILQMKKMNENEHSC